MTVEKKQKRKYKENATGYLATGDSITSISFHYLVGITTVANIIGETCATTWKCLHTTVIPPTKTQENWLAIAREFEDSWNFNHCIGAIDGKHVKIECQPNVRSAYFNYKNHHSIVLLGICDAQYLFTFVDIGAYGRRSNGGIFRDSIIAQNFANKKMNVLDEKLFSPDGPPLPYVFVVDKAF
ncbi:uncharacterized protein LOC109861401 [Pseudomyrmex gracilis]|uniref:uncharacterized protein LOC109861401 n=1 Tax=Pseudomyrmex gracilis TaxID=219809 RepID=UPI000994F754|nr:uncharacterized protein LOC109861401 [Pseudomyrmex gracilis]